MVDLDFTKRVDVEAERQVIEALLHAPKDARRLCAMVQPCDFTDPQTREVFASALNLLAGDQPVNERTVRSFSKFAGSTLPIGSEIFRRVTPEEELVARAERAAAKLIELTRYRRAIAGTLAGPGADALARPAPPAPQTQAEWLAEALSLASFAAVEQSLPTVEWLWDGWLARGIVSVLASSPGEGKSAIALEVARRAMGGADAWPDGKKPGDAGDAILVDTEAAEAILRQRVTDWSLPKDRLQVFAARGPAAGLMHMALDEKEDLDRLQCAVKLLKPALVIVDSLSGAHAMEENSSMLRGLLLKLATLARDSRSAFLVVHHLRKRARGEPDTASLDRLRGSSTIAQFARIIWAIDRPDPGDPRRRLFQVKNNLVAWPKPVGFTISDKGLAFAEAPTMPRSLSPVEQAVEFLESLLRGHTLAGREVIRQASECGFSQMMVYRASWKLKVVKAKSGLSGTWEWCLPTGEK